MLALTAAPISAGISAIAASVGQVPFNFQIGDDVKKIPLRKPQSAAGELEVRIDGCEGEKIATLPLAPAAKNYAVTRFRRWPSPSAPGSTICASRSRKRRVDPLWVLDAVQLVGLAELPTALILRPRSDR